MRVNGLSDEALYVVLSKMLARRAIWPKLRRRLAPVYVLMLGLGMFSVVHQRSGLVVVAGLSIGVAAMLGVWIAFLYTLSGERRLDAAARALRARTGEEALSGLGLSAVEGTGIYPQNTEAAEACSLILRSCLSMALACCSSFARPV